MTAAHIAGLPMEEALLSFGGPAALCLAATVIAARVRGARARLASVARHRVRADDRA